MNFEKSKSCTFTGHRASKLPWRFDENVPACIDLKNRIYDTISALYGDGVRHFICGMANGCDMYFGEAVLALRAYRDDVTLEAAVPFDGQSKLWPPHIIQRYDRLAAESDKCTLICQDYTPDCMQRRNEYMVDHAAYLIAAYNGASGGTRNTILYAMRCGLQIIELPI